MFGYWLHAGDDQSSRILKSSGIGILRRKLVLPWWRCHEGAVFLHYPNFSLLVGFLFLLLLTLTLGVGVLVLCDRKLRRKCGQHRTANAQPGRLRMSAVGSQQAALYAIGLHRETDNLQTEFGKRTVSSSIGLYVGDGQR